MPIKFFTRFLSKYKDIPNIKVGGDEFTLEHATEYIKTVMDEILKSGIQDNGLSIDEYEKRQYRKNRLKVALGKCTYGDPNSKSYVRDYIMDILNINYKVSEDNINKLIQFNDPSKLTVRDKFEILLQKYFKIYGYDALVKLFDKYKYVDKTKIIDGEDYYCVTKEDIEETFKMEYSSISREMTFEDKMMIVSQRIYSIYKGLGVVDEIRDMNIDGISGGVSGLPEDYITKVDPKSEYYARQIKNHIPRSYESVWLFLKGKTIHLKFLSFDSYKELERVCSNIYKFSKPGQLSQSAGYKATKMADGSRVVVLRPPFAETWVFFVRKFDIPDASLEYLIKGANKEVPSDPAVELLFNLIMYISKSCMVTGVTGEMGTGKTTLLMAMMEYIDAVFPIRAQEMFFELHLRKRYPNKNILSLQETSTLTGQNALDIIKKTDGAIGVVSEVAENPIAALMVQAAQVAFKAVFFSHHANTFAKLIDSLANSLLITGIFKDETLAKEQVINILDFNVHIKKTREGKRYISRVTECVPVQESDYPTDFRKAKTLEEKLNSFMETTLVYFQKVTGRKLYEGKDIIIFDIINNQYVIKNNISKDRQFKMIENMKATDIENFNVFIDRIDTILEGGGVVVDIHN